jgi:hypothetical protein
MEGTTIGTIVEAITARYDAAQASGEWPDRPRWQQPLAAPLQSPPAHVAERGC